MDRSLDSKHKLKVNIFSNNRNITKCQSLLHDDDNDDAKAIAIPQVFSKNSPAKYERKQNKRKLNLAGQV